MPHRIFLAAILLAAAPIVADAGPVGSACQRSDRPAASRQLCACIDRVAMQTLSRADQRRAAQFFRDPDLAQQVRMHKSPATNDFWRRYRAFASSAESHCR